MQRYAQQLAALHHAVMRGEHAPMLPYIAESRAESINAQTRLDAYATGYTERLAKVTLADYPALAQYLGQAKLLEHIRAYTAITPSLHWDLNGYPQAFAEYFSQHYDDAAAQALAKLESAILQVFWAPHKEALSPQILTDMPMEILAEYRFIARPSAIILRSDYDADSYISAFRQGNTLNMIAQAPSFICVVRNYSRVERLPLDEVEYVVLSALYDAKPLGEALASCTAAQEEALSQNLACYIQRWLEAGLFSQAEA
ncbi:MAG: DNA-binding domain-containing protein [Alphaproteobacteria bacterium]|nr:DNA-binding domain-containing protein [Alphaproteobacteria bacterium]